MDLITLETVDEGLMRINPEYVVAIEDPSGAGVSTRVFLAHQLRPFVDVKGDMRQVAQRLFGLIDDGRPVERPFSPTSFRRP